MQFVRRATYPIAAVAATLMLTSCAVNEMGIESGSDLSGTLVGGGSSAQQAAQEAWVAGFQSANPDTTIEYDPVGSGAGRDTFMAGGSSFAGSDRAFTVGEIEAGRFGTCEPDSGVIELPTYISPIALVFNLDGIKQLNLDANTIARIFTRDITRWNDDAIVSQNPETNLPDLPIAAVHRADDSGVTENFTDYLAAAAPEVWTFEPDGVWPLEGGEAAPQTSGVVSAIVNGIGTIGYADASRAGDLGTVAVKVGGEYVPYSTLAAAAIIDASPIAAGRAEGDLAIEIDRTTTSAGVYPIVLVSYSSAARTTRMPARLSLQAPTSATSSAMKRNGLPRNMPVLRPSRKSSSSARPQRLTSSADVCTRVQYGRETAARVGRCSRLVNQPFICRNHSGQPVFVAWAVEPALAPNMNIRFPKGTL